MTKTNKMLSVAAAAMGGLLAGSAALHAAQNSSTGGVNISASTLNPVLGVKTVQMDDTATTQPAAKHDCKGMNDCKGQGGCNTGDNGCKGKNSCKGKGGCKTADATTQPSSGGM